MTYQKNQLVKVEKKEKGKNYFCVVSGAFQNRSGYHLQNIENGDPVYAKEHQIRELSESELDLIFNDEVTYPYKKIEKEFAKGLVD